MGIAPISVRWNGNYGERCCKNYDANEKKTQGEIAVSKEAGGIL